MNETLLDYELIIKGRKAKLEVSWLDDKDGRIKLLENMQYLILLNKT